MFGLVRGALLSFVIVPYDALVLPCSLVKRCTAGFLLTPQRCPALTVRFLLCFNAVFGVYQSMIDDEWLDDIARAARGDPVPSRCGLARISPSSSPPDNSRLEVSRQKHPLAVFVRSRLTRAWV